MATVLVIDGATYAGGVATQLSRKTGQIVPEALLNIVINSVPAEAVPDLWLRRRPVDNPSEIPKG